MAGVGGEVAAAAVAAVSMKGAETGRGSSAPPSGSSTSPPLAVRHQVPPLVCGPPEVSLPQMTRQRGGRGVCGGHLVAGHRRTGSWACHRHCRPGEGRKGRLTAAGGERRSGAIVSPSHGAARGSWGAGHRGARRRPTRGTPARRWRDRHSTNILPPTDMTRTHDRAPVCLETKFCGRNLDAEQWTHGRVCTPDPECRRGVSTQRGARRGGPSRATVRGPVSARVGTHNAPPRSPRVNSNIRILAPAVLARLGAQAAPRMTRNGGPVRWAGSPAQRC